MFTDFGRKKLSAAQCGIFLLVLFLSSPAIELNAGAQNQENAGGLIFATRNVQNQQGGTPPELVAKLIKWQNKTVLRQKVLDFVAEFERSSNLPLDANAKIVIDFADLNKDGTPEAFLIINSFSTCGSRGCSSFVLSLEGATARSIGDFIALRIDVLASETGGWQDISLNGLTRVTFGGGKYGR